MHFCFYNRAIVAEKLTHSTSLISHRSPLLIHLFTTNTTFIHFDFKSKHCYWKCDTASIVQVTIPVYYAACSSLIVQTRCDLKPFAHFERERESARGDSHRLFMKLCYLTKKYELYITFSIIIISPAPDRDWDIQYVCMYVCIYISSWDPAMEFLPL